MKKTQLFLLHFAGGSRYSFQFLHSLLLEFEVHALELPGRGKRMGEDLLRDFDAAAQDLYNQILQQTDSMDYIIYGHSLGAYLALTVTHMLEKANRGPACLVVSGNAGPGVHSGRERYLLDHEAFLDELKRLGGVPKEVLEDEELLDFVLPVLRADFELADKNYFDESASVSAPIFVLMGSEEEDVKDVGNWGKFTRSSFGYKIVKGGHFFIFDHPHEIARSIRLNYEKSKRHA